MSNGNAPFGFYSECYAWHQSVILPVIIGHKIAANGCGYDQWRITSTKLSKYDTE